MKRFALACFLGLLFTTLYPIVNLHAQSTEQVTQLAQGEQTEQSLAIVSILIQPLGDFSTADLPAFKTDMERFYHAEITVLPAIPLPEFKTARGRYRAEDLLDYLGDRCPAGSKVIGFTNADIATKKGANNDWGIFGLGDLSGSAAIVSGYRIKATGNAREVELAMVARHEIGHTLGLKHCDNSRCLMAAGDNLSPNPIDLCPRCARKIIRFLNK